MAIYEVHKREAKYKMSFIHVPPTETECRTICNTTKAINEFDGYGEAVVRRFVNEDDAVKYCCQNLGCYYRKIEGF